MKRIAANSILLPAGLLIAALVWGQGLDFSGRTNQPAGVDISGTWYPQPGQDAGLITASGALWNMAESRSTRPGGCTRWRGTRRGHRGGSTNVWATCRHTLTINP